MSKKDKQKVNFLLGTFGTMFLIVSAMAAGRPASGNAGKGGATPNYDDSIAAFDAKYQPRVDSLRNKIRSAMSDEEIDYADFRELIRIDEMRTALLKKKKVMADSLAKQR